jgi:hypothetical protein
MQPKNREKGERPETPREGHAQNNDAGTTEPSAPSDDGREPGFKRVDGPGPEDQGKGAAGDEALGRLHRT